MGGKNCEDEAEESALFSETNIIYHASQYLRVEDFSPPSAQHDLTFPKTHGYATQGKRRVEAGNLFSIHILKCTTTYGNTMTVAVG